MIPQRALGNSGIMVSEAGLGCNRIGEDILPDDAWIRLLHHAADRGVNIFDTAALAPPLSEEEQAAIQKIRGPER